MGLLIRTGSCPFCDNGHKTPCYAEFTDGYKCYSCGVSKSYNREQQAFLGFTNKPQIKEGLTLPEYNTNPSNFTLLIKQWLYKYYVYDDLICKCSIWSEGNSLLFPTIENDKIVFFQQRFFPDKKIYGHGMKIPAKFTLNKNDTVVLVEDFISAVRVFDAGYDAWCLWGTSLAGKDIKKCLEEYSNIIFWLDGDEAGTVGTNKLEKYFRIESNKLRKNEPFKFVKPWQILTINTILDPKEYTKTEIKEYINEKIN